MSMSDGFIAELAQEAEITRKVLSRLPEDKLTWKPHEKSMSLGVLGLHVAETPGQVADLITQNMDQPPSFDRPQPSSRAEILKALDASIAHATTKLSGWNDAKMGEEWSLTAGGQKVMAVPRAGMVRAIMLNHWYHHRGQLTVYLRLLDEPVPSVYGPSADENPFG
jgi:uncharacterized damage-inducible protein DinB